MTKRKYNKIIKLLDKVYTILRKEEYPAYKTESYARLKSYMYRSMRIVADNKKWWIK